MSDTKIVDYIDSEGRKRRVMLPKDVPDTEAYKGIRVGIDLSDLYPEPFASTLEEALLERNITLVEDFKRPGILTEVRRAIQNVVKADANKTVDYILKRGIYK